MLNVEVLGSTAVEFEMTEAVAEVLYSSGRL